MAELTEDQNATVRLFLREKTEGTFTDEDLDAFFTVAETIEGTLFLGWMMKAADAADASISKRIGNTSESYGQPTETYRICMSQANYWKSKDDQINGSDWSAGRWMEIVPDGSTIVSELLEQREVLESFLETAGYTTTKY